MDDKLTVTLKGQVNKPFPSSRNIWVVLLLVLMVPLIIGCAGRYGHLQRDADVTSMFATNNVPQTYRYYADGRSGMPYAIIGIDPNVPFEKHYWESVDANTETFAQKVRFIWRPNGRAGHPQGQGAYILGPEGNRIGIWYSMYAHTTIVVHGDGRLEVYSPYRSDGGP
jgi:hypothetical protein